MKKLFVLTMQSTGQSTKQHSGIFAGVMRVFLIAGLLLSIGFSSAFSRDGVADDVNYSLAPLIDGTVWNGDLGLKDGLFYGGKLNIDFGPLIGLEATYLTSGDLWTDFKQTGLRDTAGMLVQDQRVKVRRFGGNLIVKWPVGKLSPFLGVGGGVIRFEPESGPKSENIDVRVGGGLDYIIANRLRMRARVEMNRFRLDRYMLAPGGIAGEQYPIDPDADKIHNNFSIGLSLDYAIGQSRFQANRTKEKLRPFSVLEIEPLVGRLDFDDSRMSTVSVAGARIGGELNPWVGWGLYYWHAMESDFSDTKPLQSYGGEARFNLASKSGPQPYVSIGAGQLDFRSGYTGSGGMGRDDRTAFILGAGIRAEIFSGLQLNVGVRDLMYGEEDLDRISGTDEISHNWLLSGALVFGVGGGGSDSKPGPTVRQPVYPITTKTKEVKEVVSKPMVETVLTDTTAGTGVKDHTLPSKMASDNEKEGNDTVLAAEERQRKSVDTVMEQRTPVSKGTHPNYVSGKNVVIPVPLEGEIYIRYGKTSRDIGETVFKGVPQVQKVLPDISNQEQRLTKEDSVVSTIAPAAEPSPETAIITPSKPQAAETTPVSRNEIDSLLAALKSDITTILAAQSDSSKPLADEAPPQTSGAAIMDDSLVTVLRKELAASEQERRRLDSLLKVPAPATQAEPDSLADRRLQQEIADQVAAALAAKSEDTQKEITQADLQNMMAVLSARIDSVTSQKASIDAARLRDQLQLEIVKQTKSQEEFQRAMEDYLRRYGEEQESQAVPPAIVVTQPAPAPQVVERDKPSTVVIQPDTQYVVIRDTTGQEKASLPITGLDVSTSDEEKDFIDLRPTGYAGFGLEKPKQFILGGRLDIGPITAKEEKLRLAPEFALGLGGGGVSVMAVMNAEYLIADIETGDYRLSPYARMGFGVLGFGGDIEEHDTEGVLNFTYGLSVDPRKTGLFRGIGNPVIFVEHQIIDLFDLNRVVLGFQWSR